MKSNLYAPVEEARQAALQVLLNNASGPYRSLPRTAAWGYPEPYTRDLMISSLGILATGNELLVRKLRRVLESLARNQSLRGNIPSLAHDPENRGASDTTPLFLVGLGIFRRYAGEPDFLDEAAQKALTWMEYQSPDDFIMVAQQPTTDWRDEQWVLGYGLFVNTLVYAYLRLFGRDEQADLLGEMMNRFDISGGSRHGYVHQGLVVPHKPYYALWAFKVHASERFDLLGNSLAVLSGIASPTRAANLITWVEAEVRGLRERGDLALDLPPNLFPYIQREDPDWRIRYEIYGRPGEYHNGGIWPFICGFYVAAAVAAGHPAHRRAEPGRPDPRRHPRAHARRGLRLQRVDLRLRRHPARPGLADVVGGDVPLRGRLRRAGQHAVLRRDQAAKLAAPRGGGGVTTPPAVAVRSATAGLPGRADTTCGLAAVPARRDKPAVAHLGEPLDGEGGRDARATCRRQPFSAP